MEIVGPTRKRPATWDVLICGQMILLVVDTHSKWIEAFIVSMVSSATTIDRLRQVFAQFQKSGLVRVKFPSILCFSQIGNLSNVTYSDSDILSGLVNVWLLRVTIQARLG